MKLWTVLWQPKDILLESTVYLFVHEIDALNDLPDDIDFMGCGRNGNKFFETSDYYVDVFQTKVFE